MTEQLPIPDLQNGHQQQFADVEDFLALFNTKMQAANRSLLVIHRISVFLFRVCFWGEVQTYCQFWIHFWLDSTAFFDAFFSTLARLDQGAGNFDGIYSEVVSADSVDFTDYSWMTLQESHGWTDGDGRWGRWGSEFVGQVATEVNTKRLPNFPKIQQDSKVQILIISSVRILMKLT